MAPKDVLETLGDKLADGPGRKALAGAAVPAAAAGVAAAAAARRRQRRRGVEDVRFALRRSEAPPDGLRRVATEQVDLAIAQLTGRTAESRAEAVHGARKGFKRLRALVRLARGELGDDVYRRENAAFRDAGRALAGARDAEVLVQTLDDLERRSGTRFPQLRAGLEADRAAATAELERNGSEGVVAQLAAARARVQDWPLRRRSFRALAPGLRRTYRRGRRALAAAREDPSDQNLHELRKRVKDGWHATQLLRPADPEAMKALADDLHALSDRLGDDHDLAVLSATAAERPEAFPTAAVREDFAGLVGVRRAELQADALTRARRLYRRRPKRFVGDVRRRWEKRVRK